MEVVFLSITAEKYEFLQLLSLGQKFWPLNCLWNVEQDAVIEWALLRWSHQLLQPYSTVRRWNDEIEF